MTSIEWTRGDDGATGETWNPVRGCSILSEGCRNCYAMKQAHRFSGKGRPYEGLTVLGNHGPRWTGEARFVPEMLNLPLRWKKPRRIFVNSMSDIFHSDVTDEQIAAVFGVMASCPQHTFQLLTKRAERMCRLMKTLTRQTVLMAALDLERETHPKGDSGPLHIKHCADPEGVWPLPNVWLGVSCEDQQRADERIPQLLLDTPAAVRFISAEPLLGPIDLRHVRQDDVYSIDALTGDVREGTGANGTGFRYDRGCVDKLDWVIVGGESGPRARMCEVAWVRSIVKQCEDAGVACFVKQLGSRPYDGAVDVDEAAAVETFPTMELGDRKGGTMDEWPRDIRVRQFPEART